MLLDFLLCVTHGALTGIWSLFTIPLRPPRSNVRPTPSSLLPPWCPTTFEGMGLQNDRMGSHSFFFFFEEILQGLRWPLMKTSREEDKDMHRKSSYLHSSHIFFLAKIFKVLQNGFLKVASQSGLISVSLIVFSSACFSLFLLIPAVVLCSCLFDPRPLV